MMNEPLIRERYIARANIISNKLDINNSSGISRDELQHAFEDDKMVNLLSSLEVDGTTAARFFDLLDEDGSGQVSFPEFVLGCLKLRG